MSAQADGSATSGGEVVVDARGTLCPMPIIMLARRCAELPLGATVTVMASDVAARYDVPAWARMTANTYIGEKETDGGAWALTVRLGS